MSERVKPLLSHLEQQPESLYRHILFQSRHFIIYMARNGLYWPSVKNRSHRSGHSVQKMQLFPCNSVHWLIQFSMCKCDTEISELFYLGENSVGFSLCFFVNTSLLKFVTLALHNYFESTDFVAFLKKFLSLFLFVFANRMSWPSVKKKLHRI